MSSLESQRAILREESAELQRTLLDQETAFSYTLRNCQSERQEREQMIGRLEQQVSMEAGEPGRGREGQGE